MNKERLKKRLSTDIDDIIRKVQRTIAFEKHSLANSENYLISKKELQENIDFFEEYLLVLSNLKLKVDEIV